MRMRSLLALAVGFAACNGGSSTKISEQSGGAGGTPVSSGGRGGSGGGSGGTNPGGGTTSTGGIATTGGATSTAGAATGGTTATGGATGTGGGTATGGATGSGGVGRTGGASGTGGAPSDAGADSGARLDVGQIGSGGSDGGGAGGARADVGADSAADARLDSPIGTGRDGNRDVKDFTQLGTDTDGGTCPYTGHISYSISNKSANPTTAEQAAYDKITAAMDQAIAYYNCYTDITKVDNVVYDPSVATADGNANGTIHFGASTTYMVLPTAMHEISHTVGIGQASNWKSFVAIPDGGGSGPWTGANANAQLRAITGNATQTLTADTQHFWPYGLNYDYEYVTEADLLDHCAMVMAIRKDLGL